MNRARIIRPSLKEHCMIAHRTRRANFLFAAFALALVAADWPGFRGPTTNGISEEKGLPVRWGPTENVLWKTSLPGHGASSPIVWKDRVFVTCFTGKTADEIKRHLLCVDAGTGKVLWQKELAAKLPENDYTRQLLQHGFTTSTPVTDGERVYVFYGRSGALAYDFDGNVVWHTDLGKALNGFGTGSSPVLYGNLLFINSTVENRSLTALDKSTGKIVWKKLMNGDAWTTPLVVRTPQGKDELVFSGQAEILGFEPQTGEQLWMCEVNSANYVSSTPVVRDGVIYLMGAGAGDRQFIAIRAGGRGDVTRTHVVWNQPRAGASYCSPVLVGDQLYYFSESAYCLKADSGEIVYQERLAGLGREYASPVVADGKIYVPTRRGIVHVLKAGDKLEVLSSNNLDDPSGFTGSPAVSGGRVYLRSNEYLYCVGEKD
jgi:outer membrane protein assembly factor BamB